MNPEDLKLWIKEHGISGSVAVAVSGGADSMALGYCLSHFTDLDVHIVSVDHGLRAEAALEIELVRKAALEWGAEFSALRWEHEALEARVQEQARRARYELMAEYCAQQGIGYLFLGHHMDDQAETFLFRLAKGSGLDGLSGMREKQNYSDDLVLLRPFLGVEKAALVEFCEGKGVSYVDEPSNHDEAYARVRIRQAREVLEAEGLSTKRLAVTAKRMARAREALEIIAEEAYEVVSALIDANRIVFNLSDFVQLPDEIALRVLLKAIDELRPERDYAPRMERVEVLAMDLMRDEPFRKRTLGGVVFERDDKAEQVILSVEIDRKF